MDTSKPSNELDLVFCCDCTSSMASYIETAKQNIRKISESMHAMEARDMRYGLVCYRDHPPQDNTYAVKVFNFTPSIQTMQQNINTMSAQGGGDGPESVSCALDAALNMEYRKNSVRVCVVIADAPPHGLQENGDGFPQGCPCGIDPLVTARKMAEKQIIIYSVACEPNLGQYKNARAFFKSIAEITHGRYLSLTSAHLLPQVIIGGSIEELDLKKLETEVVQEVANVKTASPELSEAQVEERVCSNLNRKGINTWQLNVSHQTESIENADILIAAPSLTEACAHLPSTSSTSSDYSSVRFRGPPSSVPSYPTSSAPQTASYAQAPLSKEQVSRVMKRKN